MNKRLLSLIFALAFVFGIATPTFAANQSASQQITITVVAKLGINTLTLPGMVVGQAYNATISVTGGVAPYTFSVDAASVNPLPTGLTLNAATGVISGTTSALPASCTVGSPCSIKVTFDVTDSTP